MGLVLAGGAARGAYEVGVVQHLLEEVAKDLGRDIPLDVLSGTSVGAINVCGLAAFADDPRGRARRLVDQWQRLQVDDVVRPQARGLLTLGRSLFGGTVPKRGWGLLDPAGLERFVGRALPVHRIEEHLRSGLLHAVSVSTTHVASGRTVVFLARAAGGEMQTWSRDTTVVPRQVRLGLRHMLASASLPFLFPAIEIEGEYYADGGLRQNVPLSPARRLGADALVVVNPRSLDRATDRVEPHVPHPTPFLLLGKLLNAIFLERLDADLDRLERINAILDAGTRIHGEGFVDELNRELGRAPGREVRPVRTLLVRASRDLTKIAGDHVRSPRFAARASGIVGKLLLRLAEGDGSRDGDLLSFLLFDGDYAQELIELGRADARARHNELCQFFTDVFEGEREP